MPRKANRPLLFCEWAAGTTIPSILGPLPKKKSKRRGVVKVEVTTDDESEEDSLKITYPRSELPARSPESVVKKVRFEEAPQKSALKKTVIIATESEEASSESATEPSSASSKSSKSSKSRKSKKISANETSSDESSAASSDQETPSASSEADSESEPHPTCECVDCVRGRSKAKTVKSHDSRKPKKPNCETRSDTSEADDEASESALDSEEAVIVVKKSKPKKDKGKSKQQLNKKKTSEEETTSKDETKSSQGGKQGRSGDGNDEHTKARSKLGKEDGKLPLYPEAFPIPHPRRPHLIEPVRAEVVQTERVVETPEDPPPNAFFDTEHNIIRVYYGPVYGNHHGRSLYPRRDLSNRPLPMGMPHPSQHSYYHSFNAVNGNPPQPLTEHAPMTHGMPSGPWGAVYPPHPWYPSAYPGGPAQSGPPEHVNQDQGSNKGAFNMRDVNAGQSTSSNMKDKNAVNNVGPGSVKGLENNPYIPKRNKSQFSTYGSNRSASAASQQGGKTNDWRQSNHGNNANDGAGDPQPPQADPQWGNQVQDTNSWINPNPPQDPWGTGSNTQPQDTWESNQQPQQDTWGNGNTTQTDAWGNSTGNNVGNDAWGNTENPSDTNNNTTGDGGTWDNDQTQQADNVNDNQPDTWGEAAVGESSLPTTDNNNVGPPMPGAWQETAPVPSWGDPTMAADTHGKIDSW